MSTHNTALLLVDPLNDFIAEGGKLWPYARAVAEGVQLLPHLCQLASAARASGTQIVYVPHHRHVRGDYEGWRNLNPTHLRAKTILPFERGTWGAEFHAELPPQPGDVIATEHWLQDGFMNTDLELQLRVRGIERVLIAGMRTNTCVEATARRAVELGHHVTIVKDASAAFRWDEWRATIEVNAPTFAHAIVSTADALESLSGGAAATREAVPAQGKHGSGPPLPREGDRVSFGSAGQVAIRAAFLSWAKNVGRRGAKRSAIDRSALD